MDCYTEITNIIYNFAEKQTGIWDIIKDEKKEKIKVEYRRRLRFSPFTEFAKALEIPVYTDRRNDLSRIEISAIKVRLQELKNGLDKSILDALTE